MSFLNITLGNYYPARSRIHSLDPRLKVASLAVLMILTFAVTEPGAVLLHSCLAGLCILASSVPVRIFYRGLRVFLFLFLFTAVLHLFFTPGEPLVSISEPFRASITREGVVRGLLVSWRLVTVIALSSLLTYTTTPLAITRALESLLGPLSRVRFPVQDFSLMMMMSIRFIPVLTSETDRVWKAQRSRGADLRRGGLRKRAATLMSIVVPVFTALFRRADDLALALEARGYVPGGRRTSMHPLAWKGSDTAALVLVAAWSATIVVSLLAGR
ncbi:MAG: energy-coupling factor transporter transmembrane protein EcfT [bacterium]|nr:MAG: energy-coupling factor transporter transmembrane protein EcfT [bacterium]